MKRYREFESRGSSSGRSSAASDEFILKAHKIVASDDRRRQAMMDGLIRLCGGRVFAGSESKRGAERGDAGGYQLFKQEMKADKDPFDLTPYINNPYSAGLLHIVRGIQDEELASALQKHWDTQPVPRAETRRHLAPVYIGWMHASIDYQWPKTLLKCRTFIRLLLPHGHGYPDPITPAEKKLWPASMVELEYDDDDEKQKKKKYMHELMPDTLYNLFINDRAEDIAKVADPEMIKSLFYADRGISDYKLLYIVALMVWHNNVSAIRTIIARFGTRDVFSMCFTKLILPTVHIGKKSAGQMSMNQRRLACMHFLLELALSTPNASVEMLDVLLRVKCTEGFQLTQTQAQNISKRGMLDLLYMHDPEMIAVFNPKKVHYIDTRPCDEWYILKQLEDAKEYPLDVMRKVTCKSPLAFLEKALEVSIERLGREAIDMLAGPLYEALLDSKSIRSRLLLLTRKGGMLARHLKKGEGVLNFNAVKSTPTQNKNWIQLIECMALMSGFVIETIPVNFALNLFDSIKTEPALKLLVDINASLNAMQLDVLFQHLQMYNGLYDTRTLRWLMKQVGTEDDFKDKARKYGLEMCVRLTATQAARCWNVIMS